MRYFADKNSSIFFQRAITQERGIIPIRKKIHVSYFFMKNPYMKFQNPSMHSSKRMLCIKKYAVVKMLIYSSIPIYLPGFKALASIAFEIFCLQDFIYIFSKGHNSGKGHNPDGKIRVSYFFMKNPYMKFQNPSMHGSEVILCIKKCNGRTDGWTDGRTDTRTNVPEAICPSNFFEVGGIKTVVNKI